MPYFRKSPCAYPNCHNYAEKGSQYCAEHKKDHSSSRDTTSKFVSFYKMSRWRTMRSHFLQTHIWCEECQKNGRYTPANTVHHTHGFNSYATFFDTQWWEAVCASCHSQIHTQVNNEELYERYKDRQ